jgi:hypothetical protein
MSTKFVTALYINLNGTNYNGVRDAIYERYRQSLRSLAKGGYDIVCYTSQHKVEELREFFADYPNVEFVVYELNTFPYHEQIVNIKSVNPQYTSCPSWVSRCVEIMWGKFFWLKEAAKAANPDDHIFWIDSGIFHDGLIHIKWLAEKAMSPFDFGKITQDVDLHAQLSKHAGDKILNIKSEQVNHGCDDYLHVFGHELGRPQYGIIGGIFGGKASKVIEYADGMIVLMDKTIEAGKLLKEEELMHRYHTTSDNNSFSEFLFDTWYHEDWSADYRRGGTISFSDYFTFLAH